MSRIVKIEGLSELQAKFEEINIEFHPKVRSIVAQHGAALQQRTKSNMSAAYRGHWEGKRWVKPTGATSRSTTVSLQDGGMTAVVAPHTYYFPYLEYGTRFMSARPTLGPAFTYQSMQFIDDLKHLME